jgi:hypothetical protein
MQVSRDDAAQALAAISAAQTRSASLAAYRRTAPYLILWGGIWILGYGVQAWDSQPNPLLWPILSSAGGLASFAISRRISRASDLEWRAHAGRVAGLLLTLMLFSIAVFTLFAPVGPRAAGAFFPLLVALAYMTIGLWGHVRILLAGVAVGALTLFGYFEMAQWFFAWMAVVGGGALIGFGLWLERV